MKIGRVAATVVSTIHHPFFAGKKLLLCDLLDEHGRATGGYTIAVDQVDAGAGEKVLILDEGNSARQVLAAPEAPIRAVVVGVVDEVTIQRAERADTGGRAPLAPDRAADTTGKAHS